MTIFCPKCGARNPEGTLICRVCGNDISKQNQAKQESSFTLVFTATIVIIIFMLASFSPLIRTHFTPVENEISSLLSSNSATNTLGGANHTTSITSNTQKGGSYVQTTTVDPMDDITGVNVQISYYDNSINSYRNSTQAYGGTSASAGSVFPYTLTFSNNGNRSYVINSIRTDAAGFRLVNTSPALPYIIAPGSSIGITLFVRSPNASYVGILPLTVYEKAPTVNSTQGLWDERIGESFTTNYDGLGYNVTALPQQDSYGCGPSYMLNGLSSTGYWYQIGLSYDRCNATGSFASGFSIDYQAYTPSGVPLFPSSSKYATLNMNGSINSGDSVLVDMYVFNGIVVMLAKDWRTGTTVNVNVSAYGASYFTGTYGPFSSSGYFTGLMTDWNHLGQYNGTEQQEVYSPFCTSLCSSSAWLWMDEYPGTSASKVTFSNSTDVAVYPYEDTVLSAHNVSASYLSNGSFVTG